MNRKKVFVSAVVVLFTVFVVGALVYRSEKGQAVEGTALVRAHSPTLGSLAAKVHIVEFLDPACEACRGFFPHVKKILADNPGRIRLSVRHVPFHKGADDAVRVLEAARNQGKYWEVLEALLLNQRDWVRNHVAHRDLIWKSLEGMGLDLERIKVDMNAPEVERRMAQDLQDARTLNVKKTPEFFVNGRPLPSFGLEQLQKQVGDALRES